MRARVDLPHISEGDGIKVLGAMQCMSRHDALPAGISQGARRALPGTPGVSPLSCRPAGLSVPLP